jgi:hypothetical protein
MNVGVVGLTISLSRMVPIDVFPFALGSLSVQAAAIYLYAYNMWKTLGVWKGSPSKKLSRENSKK